MWLWDLVRASGPRQERGLRSPTVTVDVSRLAIYSKFTPEELGALRGRSVLIACHDQLAAALALIELDGIARRMVLLPPGVSDAHLPGVVQNSDVDACVFGHRDRRHIPEVDGPAIRQRDDMSLLTTDRVLSFETEWVLLTSGTTGVPKLVLHTLDSLTSAFYQSDATPAEVHWATFYDIRRYGGLQIFLRAIYGGSLVLSSPDETPRDFAARMCRAGTSHISGTPSHWRKFLMGGEIAQVRPDFVRISGEIADQTLLDSLHAAFPKARIAHAFATTEAGVGFEVDDGLSGFPAALIGNAQGKTLIQVKDGCLQIRSPGNAQRYLGEAAPQLKDAEGFVSTGDQLELAEGRYRFVGRRGGVINVGGLKVHPEEIEAVINRHPRVSMALVKARRSSITGAIVVADVVLRDAKGGDGEADDITSEQILALCKELLPAHKVPAFIRFVSTLAVNTGGKLVRPNA